MQKVENICDVFNLIDYAILCNKTIEMIVVFYR